ncbi:hypothetical protein NPIL_353931, partial [Nephila pilipes]
SSFLPDLLDGWPRATRNDACATTCGFRFSQVTKEVNPPGKPPSPSGSQEGFNYNHQTTHNATIESGLRNEINQLSSTDPKLPPSSSGKRKDVQHFNTCCDMGKGHSQGNEVRGSLKVFWGEEACFTEVN